MAILNLTHDEHGEALQKLPVGIKLAIGEPPSSDDPKGHPKRLDHFVFKRRGQKGQDVVWEPAPDVASSYGVNPREVGIIFMDDDVENVLRTQYAWWSQTECKCSGELVRIGDTFSMQAVRKTTKHPEGEAWPGNYKYSDGPMKGNPCAPCGDGCPDLEEGRCKPNGALYFNLDRFPMVGAIASIRTTSYRSIRNLSNGLMQIRKITGGRLAGIRVMLRAEPEKIAYEANDGKKRTSIAHILSLRIDATDMKVLLDNMTETAKLFAQTKLLGGGRPVQYLIDDPEREKAIEMSGEFYHEEETKQESNGAGSMAAPKSFIPPPEEVGVRSEIAELCKQLGINRAGEMSLLGQFQGRLGELAAKLKADLASKGGEDTTGKRTEVPNPRTESADVAARKAPPIQTPSGSSSFEF